MQMMMGGGYGYGYRYGYSSSLEDLMLVILVLALVGTILSLIFITPVKQRERLPKFFQILHDVFNFNGLIIEKILKAIYIFLTIYTILKGIVMLIEGADFLPCLVIIVLGPILIRIFFELIMMSVLLVKNVIQINKKLKDQNESGSHKDSFEFDYTKYVTKEQPQYTQNTAPVEETTSCPHCGGAIAADSIFCPHCGQSVQ